jgi:hypothetical protein
MLEIKVTDDNGIYILRHTDLSSFVRFFFFYKIDKIKLHLRSM